MSTSSRLLGFLAALALLVALACSNDDDRRATVAEETPVIAEQDSAEMGQAGPSGAVVPPPSPAPIAPAQSGVIRSPAFTALRGARAEFGVHEGAAYRIEVPVNWNGGLVMYAHGYRGEGVELTVGFPEIRRHLIENGYAWAASSYRANSYRPDLGVEDTLALREHFVRTVGEPRWTVLNGNSMGGHVLVSSLELHPGVYQGGLAFCGALTGIGVIDYLAAYTAAAEYIGGVSLFDAPDAQEFGRRVYQEWLPATGAGGVPTQRGLAFQSVAKYLMGGELPYWREGLNNRLTAGVNLLLLAGPDRQSTPSGRAVDTRGVRYRIDPGLGVSEDEINANVRRFAPRPDARTTAENAVFAEVTGRLTAPVLALHTTGDSFVPFSVEQEYRRRAGAAGAGDLLVQRAVRRPNHCQFEQAELTRAFDDLIAWVERGARPDGDDVLAPNLDTLGLRWTAPLRPDDPARRR